MLLKVLPAAGRNQSGWNRAAVILAGFSERSRGTSLGMVPPLEREFPPSEDIKQY